MRIPSLRLAPVPLALVVGAALVTGCSRDATAPDDALSPAEAAELAPSYAELGAATADLVALPFYFGLGRLGAAGPATDFSRSSACPGGGSVAVSGHVERSTDEATKTVKLAVTATVTHAACAFQSPNGTRIVLDAATPGQPSVTLTASRTRVDGKPSGPQVTTQKGAFVVKRGDSTRTCAVDLTSTFDPAASTLTVKGDYCGRAVDRTVARGHG